MCPRCESLLDLRSIFHSFEHTGRTLKQRKKVYLKSPDAVYRDLKHQNEFLLKTVFDAKGNYVYHRDCIKSAFGVGSQRLARLRKVLQQQTSRPFVELRKEDVHRYSDLVLSTASEDPASSWLQSQPNKAVVTCCSHPERHGNAGKNQTTQKVRWFVKNF